MGRGTCQYNALGSLVGLPKVSFPHYIVIMLIDTHVHLDSYSDEEVGAILWRASKVGVGFVISAGTTIGKTERSLELSRIYPDFFSGVGIHPMDILRPLSDIDIDRLKDLAMSSDKVLVMSEIGLDYMQSMPDRAWQFDAFRQQIRIARELNLPIIFHSREAHDDCFRVLREEKAYQVGGVMHYFQGSQYDAEQMIDMGFFISIARPIFRLEHLRVVVEKLPLECIVIETDAFPQPFKKNRESWTEPRHLRPIIEKIAELKSRDVLEVEDVIFNNMKRLLQSRWDKVDSYISGT